MPAANGPRATGLAQTSMPSRSKRGSWVDSLSASPTNRRYDQICQARKPSAPAPQKQSSNSGQSIDGASVATSAEPLNAADAASNASILAGSACIGAGATVSGKGGSSMRSAG